ncbi:endonuclease III [Candidatus Gracilibacteria bacterium]|nr:endonuclease III [Candidatus Gracilibacteria bacterium]
MTKRSERIEVLKKTVFEMFPNAETELYHENEFQLLIAILMSAQATDKQVNIINRNFFQHLITPEDGIRMGVEEITDFINSVSFFNNKAKNIFKTCEILIREHHSLPPKSIEELIKLPGVGIKTAKVFLSVTEKAPFLGVDTHVHRVLNRIGIVTTKSPLETDKKASQIFRVEDLAPLHNTLVLFGRYHCTARSPKCGECQIKSVCSYKHKNI